MHTSRFFPAALALTTALTLTACGGASHGTTAPAGPGRATVLGPQIADSTGNLTGALGAWTLDVDPTDLSATLLPVHQAQATSFGQGDNYELSIRPFFRPRDLRISGVSLDPDGKLRVTVSVTHPFEMPADTSRPATASKRLDLFVFETDIVLVADGTDSFFGGEAVLRHGFLANADGYRATGPLFDPAEFNVLTANTFPYVMVGDVDLGDPDGNYDPANDGWQGANLTAATGYGVFPQGASVERDLLLDLGSGTTVGLGLVVVAKYQDPRDGTTVSQKRANRLPDPTDPTALRYHLPHGAGDLERISVNIAGALPDNDPNELTGLSGTILDWDGGATAIDPGTWPNEADLSQLPEPSVPQNAQADIPDLQASGPFNLTLSTLAGEVETDLSGVIRNADSFPVTGAPVEVKGLLRVEDSQDDDDASPTGVIQQVLSEASTVPLPNPETTLLPTVRYQAFTVTVNDGAVAANSDSPTCGAPGFGPSYNSGTNTITCPVGGAVSVNLDAGLPTDSHGISLYEIDWDYNGSLFASDASLTTTSGDPMAEFIQTEPAVSTRQIALRYTDNYSVPAERNSTICAVNLIVSAAGGTFTFQTQEVPINADPAQSFRDTRTYTYEYKRIQTADPQGDLYYFYRWNASPYNWYVSRSTNGGDSWGTPSQIPTPFLSGLTTSNTFTLGMSVLPGAVTSHPMIVGTSGATASTQTLAMLRGTDSGTNATTWSSATGATMGPVSDYRGAVLTGDLTDATGNRAYLLARDTNSGSPNHNRLVLFRTTNAQAATPTWTQIATPDPNGGGGLNGETNSSMVIDLAGNLHICYIAGPIGTNDVRYVKVSTPATTPTVGSETNISNSGTDNVGEAQIFVDTTNRALVVYERWLSNDSSQGRIYAARGDAAGTSFGAPVLIDNSGADCQMPDIIVEAAGGGRVIVAYMRRGVSADEIYLAARSADLLTEVVAPTRAHTDVPAADVRYPHLNIDVVRGRTIVCYERSGFGGPLSSPSSDYELRSRWFTITP